eukprot:GFKZ01012015.1.p1 GENE.GFKZ01012015.1~~GFKZ01012015.1.p1  ORF type:complete len:539 (-),score=75.93 GFKZ01012015.1:1143-2759(-)
MFRFRFLPPRPPLRPRRIVQTLAVDAPPIPPPPASPAPSTAHSLPLSGGDESQSARHASQERISAFWRNLSLPKHASWSPRDVVPAAPETAAVFVGVGLETNWPAVHAAMEGGVFGEGVNKVVAVRDVFDRDNTRVCLSDWFALVADDVVAVVRDVVRGGVTTRRFVNEYVKGGSGEDAPYVLVKNDVDLIEYLHSSGFRVVPVDTKHELDAMREGRKSVPVQQSTNHVLACAPTAFEFNRSAAADNHFMSGEVGTFGINGADGMRRKVLTEFAGLHAKLVDRKEGVGAQVHLFTHEDWHNTPDACFPNNTFSTHTNFETDSSCVLVLYPMKDETRRKERRLVQRLLTSGRYTQVYDLTREEDAIKPSFLEGTGSLVLDRVNRVAYVAESARSDLKLARQWARVMGYQLVDFQAVDRGSRAIYHTNVMMSVGTGVAVVCGESIVGNGRDKVIGMLQDTGHDVVDISMAQVEQFCGNVLELENFYGEQVMVMSTRAYNAFDEEQREKMLAHTARLVHSDISTIERVGGGGVRCTIAELH